MVITENAIAANVLDMHGHDITTSFLSPDTKEGVLAAMTACSAEGNFTIDEAGCVIAFTPQDE